MITRNPTFKYSWKSVAVVDKFVNSDGQNRIGLEIILPTDFYACVQLDARLLFLHDGTAAGRNVTKVTVASDSTTAPYFSRSITTNKAPSGLLLDYPLRLSGLRNTTAWNQVGGSSRQLVFLTFDQAISGTIKLFKIDMAYQVIGIK